MENYNLLSLTYKIRDNGRKTIYSAETDGNVVVNSTMNQGYDLIEVQRAIVNQIDHTLEDGDSAMLNGKVVNAFGTVSDEVIENIFNTTVPELVPVKTPVIKFASTYKSYNPSDIAKIKGIIYAIHHPDDPSPTPSTAPEPTVSGEPDEGTSVEPTSSDEPGTDVSTEPSTEVSGEPSAEPSGEGTGKSFITDKYNNFYNAETMFEFLSTATGGQVTKSTGITRAQLIKLTQNELAEADNKCFFGALNRIFDNTTHFNKDGNEVISFEEIDNFFKTLGFGDELGEDPSAFLNKINQYTEEIQTQYKSLSNQKRLEFIIEKTKDYLNAAGLTKQLNALNRLSGERDTANSSAAAKVGQIVIADLNGGATSGVITQGAYSSSCSVASLGSPINKTWNVNASSHPKASGTPYEIGLWFTDSDQGGADLGLTLDISLIQDGYPWYAAVDVMVHELTHATASQYTGDDDDARLLKNFAYSEIEKLHSKGAISEADWAYYQAHKDESINDIYNNSGMSQLSEFMQVVADLMYATNCMWGEYAAYQADADYMDSIAGDVFNNANGNSFGNRQVDTAVASAAEKDAIINHIWTLYDNSGAGNYNSGTGQNEIEAYPEGKLEDLIFTANARKNWTWA